MGGEIEFCSVGERFWGPFLHPVLISLAASGRSWANATGLEAQHRAKVDPAEVPVRRCAFERPDGFGVRRAVVQSEWFRLLMKKPSPF